MTTQYDSLCPFCGADDSEAKMIGDPEYNDLWECSKCGREYGAPIIVVRGNYAI